MYYSRNELEEYKNLLWQIVKEQSHERLKSKVPTILYKYLHKKLPDKEYVIRIVESNGIKNIVAHSKKLRNIRIVLNGHWDTVVPPSTYKGPKKEKTVIWGQGACDMKGGVVAAIITFLKNLKYDDIVLNLVGDEEIGGKNGTNVLVNDYGLWGKYAFIYEPTNLAVSLGQKSGLFVKYSYQGYQGHGAYPHRGPNALFIFYQFWNKIAEEFELEKIQSDDDAFDNITITPSYLKVGNSKNKNVVPGKLEGYFDIRFPPTVPVDEITTKLRELGDEFGFRFQFNYIGKGWRLKVGSPLYNVIIKTYQKVFNKKPQFIKKMGTNDGRYYAEKGSQIINIGPGDNKLSHSAKEHVDVNDVLSVAQFYSELIKQLQ